MRLMELTKPAKHQVMFRHVGLRKGVERFNATINCFIGDKDSDGKYPVVLIANDSDTTDTIYPFNNKATSMWLKQDLPDNLNFGDRKVMNAVQEMMIDILKNIYGFTVDCYLGGQCVEKEFIMDSVEITTNIGRQVTNIHCTVEKRFLNWKDVTLFERKVLGYKTEVYSINCIPIKPIRENRDKDYLEAFSDDGNDAISEFSLGITEDPTKVPILDVHYLGELVMERIEDFDPDIRTARHQERQKAKRKWTERTWCRLAFNDYKERFGIFSSIHPFHGDHLSGWTDALAIEIENDDEDGIRLCLTIAGFHFHVSSFTLAQKLQKLFVRNKPNSKTIQWEEYYPLLKRWQKEHKFEAIFHDDWSIKIGISRARGFYFSKEYDHSWGPKSHRSFNPLRNKYWNLI